LPSAARYGGELESPVRKCLSFDRVEEAREETRTLPVISSLPRRQQIQDLGTTPVGVVDAWRGGCLVAQSLLLLLDLSALGYKSVPVVLTELIEAPAPCQLLIEPTDRSLGESQRIMSPVERPAQLLAKCGVHHVTRAQRHSSSRIAVSR